MGNFDKSICDCCVCPMQCVLEQLEGQQISRVDTPVGSQNNVLLNSVEDFIAFTDEGNYAM
ncbi:hypothetical protein [Chengkuizengella sediminis]|uniref:hypothetical protein n=1 Tax=Chengkuizengella sediminis TaxID=1885917 RepID=UPI001389CA9A|nr:hypothetical protein [Chengkuizengella sediminis]NDI35451.1 hypothetical protein [Chengkuizengella sediminis]